MTLKRNVAVFDQDVTAVGGYRYTTDQRLSVRLANARMTRGIAQAGGLDGKRVLDVGCGDGTFTETLIGMGAASILAMDPAANAVEAARQRFETAGLGARIEARVFDVYALATIGERFEVAVVRGVLHHLPDAGRAVAEILKVADAVVILEPNGANPVLKVIERISKYHVEHEEQSFLPRTIDGWLRAGGAEIRYRKLINLVPLFCPAFAARVLKVFEPVVEAIPGLRAIACGQYVVRAERVRAAPGP